MILIYTHSLTNRVSYAVELVFGNVLGLSYRLTTDAGEYAQANSAKLAYTNRRPEQGLFLESGSLLFEEGIYPQTLQKCGEYQRVPVFFPSGKDSCLPYDLLSTVFYVATRYEEYLAFEADRHGRFQAEQSLAYRFHLLQRPFLNELIEDFGALLKQQFPKLEFRERNFSFLSTIDIDNAFAYAHKGILRNTAGLLKDLAEFDFRRVRDRLAANVNDGKDPYNTFEEIAALSHRTQTALQYFVLIGDYAAYDKNPHPANPGFARLLRSLAADFPMGLHPSYRSGDDVSLIAQEKARLETIIEKPVTSARCHFLRVHFPETYRAFDAAGITDDYTMIFASQCGFRTGLCVPFYWFDLERNETTKLRIHPSVVMEGTLRDYNRMSPEAAQALALELMKRIKYYRGEFVQIYHNDSFVPAQASWKNLYQTLLTESKR